MEIKLRKFQQGGQATPPTAPTDGGSAAAPNQQAAQAQGNEGAPQGGGDPIMQIAQAAAQALQNQDCEAAMAVCDAFIQLVQQGGQGAPEESAPEGEPVYRAGGKLVKRI